MARCVRNAFPQAKGKRPMSAARPVEQSSPKAVARCSTTLLDLVWRIGEVVDDDRAVVDEVLHLLESGRVRLTGNFRDALPDELR